jgi:hypothetical protein
MMLGGFGLMLCNSMSTRSDFEAAAHHDKRLKPAVCLTGEIETESD